MTTLKFVDTHNMVAFLSKPAESEGFEQIATAKAKTVNREVQLQDLVDGKKIVITESTVRRDLQLEDAEGMDCLPNATIFEELTRMRYEKFLIHTVLQCLSAKTTAWNEFSNTMASAIICLARNQKFNFSKYVFESMVKNLDNVNKFLMYPRFVQVFLEQQVREMSSHKRIYETPYHTKNIFGNMRRVGKGFSRRETPLFPTMVVQAQEEIGEGSAIPTDPQHTPTIIQPLTSQPQKKQKPKKTKRKDTEIPQSSGPTDNVADKAVNEEMDDSLVRAATTASSLEAEQDSGVNTSRSDEDSLKLKELMDFCTKLQQRVLDLENIKTAQAQEITTLKIRVTKLEKKGGLRTHKLKRLNKGRKIHDIDVDKDITLENVHDAEMFDVNDLHSDEVFVEKEVPVKEVSVVGKVNAAIIATTVSAAIITKVDITLAQALAELKNTRPKAKGLVKVQDKGKGIMVEEHLKMKKKEQVSFDEQEAKRLQAEFDDEERLARIETDYELAQKLQAEEQEELTVNEKDTRFQQLLEKRRKHFTTKRAEEKRNKPPTKAQQRSIITELVEGIEMEESSKKEELMEESSKREAAKMKELIKIVLDEEEVVIDALPLATKPPSIVGWKIIKEGKISHFQIIRADGSLKRYSAFIQMLKSFDREDLETLWKLVKAKHGSTRPEESYERVLWGDLKTMFEHHVEDTGRIVRIKRLHDDLRVIAAKVRVTTAKLNLELFSNLNEKYAKYGINNVLGPEELEQAPPPPDFVHEPIYPEFMPPEDDALPAKEQPLPAVVSPTADLPGYITESDLEEDPEEEDEDLEEDPADYPDKRDEGEEESSRDDADDEEEDKDEDKEEEEEEEH
ncbi:hypothetical protein Tco_0625400 [Tanacetum coccineum]|uniref:Uncharacterized protein n=1 Tax=Tanacetum coccineum TaxID=301880 RepID=A0ABQ4WGP6_9ASTR